MSCYMSDEEPLALPPMLPSTSELLIGGSSLNVMEMISQDVMLGMQSTSNASTEVTYVAQSAAPSLAPFTSAGDVLRPFAATTSDTFVKSLRSCVSPTSADRMAKSILNLNPRPSTAQPVQSNPCLVSPFLSNEKQLVRNPFATMSHHEHEKKDRGKTSSYSTKKSKCKPQCSHKSLTHSKLAKNDSRNRKMQSAFVYSSSEKHVPTNTYSISRSTLTHTVTRSTNIVTERTVSLTTETVTHTATTMAQATYLSADNDAKTDAATSCKMTAMSSALEKKVTLGAGNSEYTTSMLTSYTITRTRAPMSLISPMQSTILPTNVLCSRSIISRTPAPASSARDRLCEQFAILPYAIPSGTESSTNEIDSEALSRTRVVVPISMNARGATSPTCVDSTTASVAGKPVRPVQNTQSTSNTTMRTTLTDSLASSVACRTLTRSSFAFAPGATLFAARKLTKAHCHSAVTTEPHTIAILDGKGAYTTLTISSDFTTTNSPLVMTQTQNTSAGTTEIPKTSPVSSDVVRPRSQLLIPIANSQINTTTSLGYLVSTPIGSDITSRYSAAAPSASNEATTTKTIASHTITTISSEALNRIRSRLLSNVPSTAVGSLPPATICQSSRSRGPVTIITNHMMSSTSPQSPSINSVPKALFSAASQSLYAMTAPVTTVSSTTAESTRSVNRVVIPINVHATSNNNFASTQGTYIIAGMRPSAASDTVTKSSRVVIPILHNTSATVTSTSTSSPARICVATAGNVCTSSVPHTEAYSKLRSRLTIHVNTTGSSTPGTTTPITAYTVTRNRAPQSVYAISSGSSPYVSKTSEGARSPATMTLITFAPPSTEASGAPQRSTSVTTPSSARTCATPTLTSTGNRFVIKLGTGPSGGSTSSVTTSITTPITRSALSPTDHQFAEPHPVSARLRTFPGPRTYSIAQRGSGNASQRSSPVARNFNPHPKKMVTNPAPLQIFTDVVCPPKSCHTLTTVAPQSNSRSRFTLSQTPGNSTLVVPQYKNTVFKNLSTVAHPHSDRINARLLGPRLERFVLNRSVAFVSSRRSSPVLSDAHSSHTNATSGDHTKPATNESTPATIAKKSSDGNPDGQNNDSK